jgi:hypothetical protein
MRKGEKARQSKVARKRTERSQQAQRTRAEEQTGALEHIHQARNYPIEGCWTVEKWNEGGLAKVVIARRQPNGRIVFGCYLVDLYCLGLKDTFCNADIPAGLFRRNYLAQIFDDSPPLGVSPALAHEIVYGGIEFAAQFGFRPHRDFRHSRYILDPPEVHPRTGKAQFGKDGKPFYISGPYDNAEAIVRQLARTAGEGNFDYIAIAGTPPREWQEG